MDRCLLLQALLVFVITALGALGLQVAANHVDNDLLKERISLAFERHNLDTAVYPADRYGFNSIRTHIGQDQFPDCKILLSLLAADGTSLRDAVLPPMTIYASGSRTWKRCRELQDQAVGNGEFEKVTLKFRYWWGTRALVGLGLWKFSYYQITQGIKSLTYLLYMVIAVLLVLLSRDAIVAALPLLAIGIVFSGIPIYGGTTLALPYLWALVFNAILLTLLIGGVSRNTRLLWMVAGGAVSAYLFLLDGHLMLLMSLSSLILYFSADAAAPIKERLMDLATNGLVFLGSFVAMMLLDVTLSMLYLDPASALTRYWDQLLVRLSDETSKGELSLVSVANSLMAGYKRVAAYDHDNLSLLLAAGVPLSIVALAAALFLATTDRRRQLVFRIIPLCIAILLVIARNAILQNHAAIHPLFIGRYLFIVYAAGWSILLLSLGAMISSYRKPYHQEG